MAELELLTQHLGALLHELEPAERKKLARKIGQDLRKKQQQRMVRQQNPDGSGYVPRKNKLRDKSGRIKNKMFNKIKNAKFLKLNVESDRVLVGFAARVQNIARVHQFGLKDRPSRKSKEVRYAKRELLGFSEQDFGWIEDQVVQHLASSL